MGVPQPGAVEVCGDAEIGCGRTEPTDAVDRLDGAATEVVGVLDDDERGLDLVGTDPDLGHGAASGSSRPAGADQVREVIPEKTAAAPSSARTTCAPASLSSS